MPLITCTDVALAYEGNQVLSDVCFCVNKGDYLCIVGENGSGKSTLIRALAAQKKPAEGSIALGEPGQPIAQKSIGYLSQQLARQRDFPASVREVVRSGCLNARQGARGLWPGYFADEKRQARRVMEDLGLTHLQKFSYSALSCGQQQRVLLARALCAASEILLLDEPAAGLDPVVTQEMYDLIQRVNRQGMTIVMVSHDIDNAVKYGSHILHLHHRPLFFGRVEDYKTSDAGKRFLRGMAE